MTLIVDSAATDAATYSGSGSRGTMTVPYSVTEMATHMFIVVGASADPAWNSCAVDGAPANALNVETGGATGRTIVFEIDLRPLAPSGNIVITAPAAANNRSVVSWVAIQNEGAPAPVTLVDGAWQTSDYEIAAIAPSAGLDRLLLIGGRGTGSTPPVVTGATEVTSGIGSAGSTEATAWIGTIDAAATASALVDGTAATGYTLAAWHPTLAVAPYQGWPRGGNIYAPL